MGQRADNFSHAFDGSMLDWDVVFGTGFRDAPRGWTSVYRECSVEELVAIGTNGLSLPPPDAWHPDIKQEMELLDGFRPPQIIRKGVSRFGAICASLTPETPRLPLHKDKERVIIELRVEPAESYVGDADFINALFPFIRPRKFGIEKYHVAFRKYWETVIPLRNFKRHYAPDATAAGTHWFRKHGAPRSLPKMFFSPEILVMPPRISPRHIRIVKHEFSDEYGEHSHDDVLDLQGDSR